VFGVISTIYLAGAAVYVWQQRKINSGIDDLIINEGARTLDLPPAFGRKERMLLNLADVAAITIEKVEHHSSKGGISYTYAPALCLHGNHSGMQRLADWSDRLKAKDFADWLSKRINIPLQVPEQ
jgi:hypothetical protein